MNYYLLAMRRYSAFSGRSSRSEYWFYMLFYYIGYAICIGIDAALFRGQAQLLSSLFLLAHVLPGLAVGVRRLHDTDRSGWWLLITFTGIGVFVLLAWYCMRGTPGPNRFGYPTDEPVVAPQAA